MIKKKDQLFKPLQVQEVLNVKKYSSENFIKLRIDGGGEFLKMSLGIIEISSKHEKNDETSSEKLQVTHQSITKKKKKTREKLIIDCQL